MNGVKKLASGVVRIAASAHVLVACALVSLSAMASSYTWTGGSGNGIWNDAGNWGGSGYPASSSDTALFDTGTTATIDVTSEAFLGNGVAITVTNDAAVTIRSTAAAAPTFTCSPTVNAGSLTFDHVKLSGSAKSTSASSLYRFVNGASYSVGMVHTFAKGGAWYFDASTLTGTSELLLGYQANRRHDLVLANGSAATVSTTLYDRNTTAALIALTNSTLTIGGSCTLKDSLYELAVVGDASRVTMGGSFVMGAGSKLSFEYGHATEPALTLTGGGFAPNASARLEVRAPAGLSAQRTVKLVSAADTISVPSGWLDGTLADCDPEVVHLYVDNSYADNTENHALYAVYLPQGATPDPTPVASMSYSAQIFSGTQKTVECSVLYAGCGATRSTAVVGLYSDSACTQKLEERAISTDRADASYSVPVTFTGLVLGTTYYLKLSVSNDIGGSVDVVRTLPFFFPEQTSGTFTWSGLGDGSSWTNGANWSVADGCFPKNSSSTACIGQGANVLVDLDGTDFRGGSVKISMDSDARLLVRSTAAVAPTFTCSPTLSGDVVLTFDHVRLSGNAASTSEGCRYRFVNGASYSVGMVHTFAKGGAWYFDSSTLTGTSELLIGYQGNCRHDLVLANGSAATIAGRLHDGVNTKASLVALTNSTLTIGGSCTLKDSLYELAVVGDASRVTMGGSFVMGAGSKLSFNYGRADRPAISVTGEFKPNAAAKLVINAPETVRRSTEVPLVSVTGSTVIPEAWTSMTPSAVTAHEYVRAIYTRTEGGVTTLYATIAPPARRGFAIYVR